MTDPSPYSPAGIDTSIERARPGISASTNGKSSSELEQLRAERDRLSEALLWTTAQLAHVLEATLQNRRDSIAPKKRARQLVDEGAQDDNEVDADGEPREGDAYPLSANEDRRAYHRWLQERRQPTIVGDSFDKMPTKPLTKDPRSATPLVSVVLPVWRTPRWALERSIGSVFRQTFADWELCICDDASGDVELATYLSELAKLDRRIKLTTLSTNGGISAASNAAIELATGRFVTFLDHDDEITPEALTTVAKAIADHPTAQFFYSDEDKIDRVGERFGPLMKPDWSPDLLLSFAYTCHLTVIDTKLVQSLGGLRSDYDGSQDYDLALRATERADEIIHIPEVLYHWRTLPGSAATDTADSVAKPWAYDAGKRAVEDALQRRGEPATVTEDERFPGRYHVRRKVTSNPRVSIIIPFRDEPALLATCVTTMREQPGYDNIEFVLIDNNSELPETEALLDRLSDDPQIIILRFPHPFNWSTINNFGAAHATGDVFLFANNDIEARKPGWLATMLGHALRDNIGAVGAKLVYPDGSIQHAGVVIGLGGIAGHILRGLPGDRPGYNSTSIATRNCSVVTGACMMTRREIFTSVGGFNEQLAVAFNDVDYCLNVRKKGYLIVYTPLAELIHHESRSRGHTDDLVEHGCIVAQWADAIIAGDPYMNKNLSHWRYWCPLATPQEDYQWRTYLEKSISMLELSSSA